MMFEQLRERLQTVQQDFTAGFKTLGDKSKDPKIKRRPRLQDSLPHFSGGLQLLSRYEESWFLLHKRTKECALAAEAVDGDMVMFSLHWEKRRSALTQLQEHLQALPGFIAELDAITTSIEGDFEEMESKLVYLETLCSQCEQQRFQQHHLKQLELFKKQKRKELEALKVELDCEHSQKVTEVEHAIQQKLRERQKVYEEAFNQDMEQYLSTGYLQHREQTGAEVCVLDQVPVMNVSDQEALDDFLNSAGDDSISMGSSLTSGPDIESCSPDSLSSQLNYDQVTATEQDEEAASKARDEPVVQLDEEDVQFDMSLAAMQEVGSVRDSDESDSVGDLPSS
ncbi:dysbindin-A-like isoform X2 [Genypterus blacodes]|uniref:dysbindin-A-like isoform X2 n=1 Tax=Genypterus blacodes TaxID=154954 RepID=UPI003F76B890